MKNRKLKESAKAGPRYLELYILVRVNRLVEGYCDIKLEEIAYRVHYYLISGRFLRLLVLYSY